MKIKKYTKVEICPIKTYGSSTGRAPIQVKINKTLNSAQIENFITKLKEFDLNIQNFKKGKTYNTATDKTKAITPPSLLGIERRMAYANKKYHSG